MQRGIKLLALCCTFGFGLSIVFAEDSFFTQQPTAEEPNLRTIQYFSRSGEKGTDTVPAKPTETDSFVFDKAKHQSFTTTLPSRYERMKSSTPKFNTAEQSSKQPVAQQLEQKHWKIGMEKAASAAKSVPQQFKRATQSPPAFTTSQEKQQSRLKSFVSQLDKQALSPKAKSKLEQFSDWNPKLRPLPAASNQPTQNIQTANHIQAVEKKQASRKPSPLELILAEYEELEAETGKQDVQQISATKENRSPFAKDIQAVSSTPTFEQQPVKTVAYEKAAPQPKAVQPVAGPTLSQLGKHSGVPHVSLEWVKRTTINVGQECQCDLVITNQGTNTARELIVEAYFPTSVQLLKTEPKPISAHGHLVWKIATLPAGKNQTIKINMIPSQRGAINTTAIVRFAGSATSQFTVEQPMLKLLVKGPKEVLLGDPATQLVTISNPGTGTAHNVQLNAVLPGGLEHASGKKVQVNVGSLNPGESRQIRLALAAIGGGDQKLLLQANAVHGLTSSAQAAVSVIAPNLKIDLAGPSLRYKGRVAKYRLIVTNDGSAASNNVRVAHLVPKGFRFVKADQGGEFDASSKTVTWYVGRLDAGQAKTLILALEATELGDFQHIAQTYSDHGSRSKAELATRVDGTASLVLEIADQNDPIEVGSETAYEIRIRNEGSKADTQVGISCELPKGVELISAKGPVESYSENGYVIFKSLKQLQTGKTAIYRIQVRGTQPGNQRFRVRLASDSIKEPLVYEELTKFYSDKF